jgi:hypothetical protein
MARVTQHTFMATDRTGQATRSVTSNLRRVQSQTSKMQALQPSWNRGLNANRRAVQQFGFQLGDFATQIAGGQSAMLAFTQQGGQMLQFFGPFGAIAAAALAVFGSMAIAIQRSGSSLSMFAGPLGELNDELRAIWGVMKSVGSAFVDVGNFIVNNLTAIGTMVLAVAGYFALQWVVAMARAAISTNTVRAAVLALRINMVTLGPAAGIAATGVQVLAGALGVLRGILITLGIPALVIGIGFLFQAFLELRKGVGSTGEAFKLLGDLARASLDYMGASAAALVPALGAVWRNITAGFLSMIRTITEKWFHMLKGLADSIQGIGLLQGLYVEIGGAALAAGKATNGLTTTINNLNDTAADRMTAASGKVRAAAGDVTTAWNAVREAWAQGRETIDLRNAFGGGVTDEAAGGGGGKSALDALKNKADEVSEAFKSMQSAIESSIMSGLDALVHHTKSVKEALLDTLNGILDAVFKAAVNPLIGGISAGIASGFANIGVIGSFAGGGFTGAGPRAGGLDGKGGHLALVHPNETVIDHQRGQSMGRAPVTINMKVVTPDAESFRKSQRQIVRDLETQMRSAQ